MADQAQKPRSDSETEIWNAIAAFEKILEALPNDRISLETLADAYEKVGDHTRAKDYILRLANVMADENDEDGARDLLRKIKDFDQNDPQVKQTITRIEGMKAKKVMAVVRDTGVTLKKSSNIAEEISFAWNLLQAKKVTQEEYSKIVHDLSENMARTTNAPVTTLHVLSDQNHPGLNDILAFSSSTRHMPLISLVNFELQSKVTSLLPLDFMIRRGAIIFELMGNDTLVAVLNPFDQHLLLDIEDITGKTAHGFLVTPADFDGALEKIKAFETKAH